ncbi:MAG TPA: bile acid:sodium symporter family protein [Elusimicrobiota bacterium]|nr:bile acid:sodium symporter family protein [Elusimicrobiota bacterium]
MFNKLCDRFSGLMMVWVVLACGAGYVWPPVLVWMKPHLDWLFMLTMLGIGIVTPPHDFNEIVKRPRLVALGMAAQFGIMPVCAFLVAKGLSLPKDLAVGLILAGAAPDAMAAGVVSYAAHADVAYSVALTGTSTLLAPVVTPALTYFFGKTYIEIAFTPMMISILKMVIAPLAVGMAIKRATGKRLDGMVALFPALSTVFIAGICGLVVALNKDTLAEVTGLVFVAVFLLNLLGLALGYGAGMLFGFDVKRRRTLAIGVGMQNAGLGAVLAIKHISARAAVPNALFATWCIVSASLLAWYWSRRDRRTNAEDVPRSTVV